MCRRRACECSPPPCSTPSMCLGVCPPCCSHPPPDRPCTQAVETRGWRKSCRRCAFSAMPSRSAVPCVRVRGTTSTSSRASPRCCASGTRAWRWRVSSGRALAEGADGGGGAGTRLPAVLCVTALLPIPLTFSFVHFCASGARGWRCTRRARRWRRGRYVPALLALCACMVFLLTNALPACSCCCAAGRCCRALSTSTRRSLWTAPTLAALQVRAVSLAIP
jgi:hypothetical protein